MSFVLKPARKALAKWISWQVEFYGQCSLERMRALEAFNHRTSLHRAILLAVFTPLPCLALIALIDAVPLAPPSEGTNANYVHWFRNYLTIVFMSYAVLEQFRTAVPGLPLSLHRMNVVANAATLGGVGFQFGMSHAIGFPLPFSIVFGTPVWATVIVSLFYVYYAPLLRANARLRKDLSNYMGVFFCQILLTFVYPAYVYGFQSIDPAAQKFYVALLPLLKIGLKNAIARFLGDLDDLKPEIVIFNVEVFNALYMACCMQRARSMSTTLVVAISDWLIALLSFQDIMVRYRDVEAFLHKIPLQHPWHGKNCIEVARLIVNDDASIRMDASLLQAPRTSSHVARSHISTIAAKLTTTTTTSRRVATMRDVPQIVPVASAVQQQQQQQQQSQSDRVTAVETNDDAASSSTSEPALAVTSTAAKYLLLLAQPKPSVRTDEAPHDDLGLRIASRTERLVFVQRVLQLLFTTEFVILLQYTIVCAPTIYSLYITTMFHMANHVYYAQLAHMDTAEFDRTIVNVQLYCGLQAVALLVIGLALKRRLQFSVFKQAAFVLTRQWTVVQWKLILWFFYCVQNSLDHFGADYSLQFAWLRSHARVDPSATT